VLASQARCRRFEPDHPLLLNSKETSQMTGFFLFVLQLSKVSVYRDPRRTVKIP